MDIPFHTIDWLFSTDRKLTQTVDESSLTISKHRQPYSSMVVRIVFLYTYFRLRDVVAGNGPKGVGSVYYLFVVSSSSVKTLIKVRPQA
jgi:hypothetical protein